jgi:hypothetical protein
MKPVLNVIVSAPLEKKISFEFLNIEKFIFFLPNILKRKKQRIEHCSTHDWWFWLFREMIRRLWCGGSFKDQPTILFSLCDIMMLSHFTIYWISLLLNTSNYRLINNTSTFLSNFFILSEINLQRFLRKLFRKLQKLAWRLMKSSPWAHVKLFLLCFQVCFVNIQGCQHAKHKFPCSKTLSMRCWLPRSFVMDQNKENSSKQRTFVRITVCAKLNCIKLQS